MSRLRAMVGSLLALSLAFLGGCGATESGTSPSATARFQGEWTLSSDLADVLVLGIPGPDSSITCHEQSTLSIASENLVRENVAGSLARRCTCSRATAFGLERSSGERFGAWIPADSISFSTGTDATYTCHYNGSVTGRPARRMEGTVECSHPYDWGMYPSSIRYQGRWAATR